MAINANDTMIQKGLETMANVTKMAANITESKKNEEKRDKKPDFRGGNSTNQPHNQTVEVKVGATEPWQLPKPTPIVEKKPETHIHKHFPDNRALTSEECSLERFRIEKEFEERDKERKHRILVMDQEYKRQMERIENERKEREKARAEKRKRNWIVGGILTVVGIGILGLNYYTNNRSSLTSGDCSGSLLEAGNDSSTAKNPSLIDAEGTVE